MTLHWSAATGGFYDTALWRAGLPPDAIQISASRHASLLAGLAEGRTVVLGPRGYPVLEAAAAVTREDRREQASAAVRLEAEARILAIAPLWRQANDNAVIALHAWRPAGELSGLEAAALAEALGRRTAIDAVRVASDVIEAEARRMTVGQLLAFDAAASPIWPA